MIQVTPQQLKLIAPNCRAPDMVTQNLNLALREYKIGEDIDFVRAFIAQLCVESGEFNSTVEGLSYSAEGLRKTWPKRFPSLAFANTYARQPQKIANYVYADRLGNGNEASGDGWRHRGMGWIQATGKTNQEALLKALGLSLSKPELLQEMRWAALSAGVYWSRKPQLNDLAQDLPADDDVADFFSISRLVNGGTIGKHERYNFWCRAIRVLQ